MRELLLDHDVPAVVVVDAAGALCGVITPTDLLAAGDHWTAIDAMSSPLAVQPRASIEAVADVMARERAEHVVVIDVRHVVGVVTAREIARQRLR